MNTFTPEELEQAQLLIEDVLYDVPVDNTITETVMPQDFKEYRISYGILNDKPKEVFYLSIYPAFCQVPKFVLHYTDKEKFINIIIQLKEHFKIDPSYTTACIATILAILKNKESIELYQEQKDLMDLGLKHANLDNYFQDTIKTYVQEYLDNKTFRNTPFELDLFKKVNNG